jgi:phage terminase large subunit-like protein
MVVPEGNGKSTLMGGVALYHGDYTPDAEVLMAASSRDQCEILFRQASGFVERTPGLRKRFRVFEGYRRIKCLNTGGRIQVFAADDRTGDGVIPTLGLIDELHRHRDLRLYRTWRGKLDKRDGQLVTISTAGEPDSEFEDTRARLRQEANSVERRGAHLRAACEQVVLHDWAMETDADVEDIDSVKAANPFTGVTREILERRRSSPTMTMQHWRRFVCNLPTRVVEAAIEESEWEAAGRNEQIPVGEPVAVGLDVGWKFDTTAIVPLWMPSRDHRLLGPATVLTPPRDGSSLDPHLVEDALLAIHERNPISFVAMDVHRAEQLGSWIEETIGCESIEVGQGNAPMGLAYERFMEGLRCGQLVHTRDPVLTRHVLNAIAKPIPLGGARFDRVSRSRHGGVEDMRVIDALIAAAMVHSVCVAPNDNPVPRFEVLV